MKVAVVTPTIGSDTLQKCIDSVMDQTYDDITHYIFGDGEQYYDKATEDTIGRSQVKNVHL